MYLSAKQYDELCHGLITNLAVDHFTDDEINQILDSINSYRQQLRQRILGLALSLSDASSSLVPGLLRQVRKAAGYLLPDDLDRWLETVYYLRDSEGIDRALSFLSRTDLSSLKSFEAQRGLLLGEAAPMLETFLRALSGQDIRIEGDQETFTDGERIYLPSGVNLFASRKDNLALYKLAAVNSWGQIVLGSLDVHALANDAQPGIFPIADVFARFPERVLALDLYTVIEAFRIEYFLMKELPGLMKQAAAIKAALYEERLRLALMSERSAFVEGLWQYYLSGKIKGTPVRNLTAAVASLYDVQYETVPAESLKLLMDFYATAITLSGPYVPRPAPLFIASINIEKAVERQRGLQNEKRRKFEAVVRKLVSLPDFEPREQNEHKEKSMPDGELEPSKEYLLIKGRLIEVSEQVRGLFDEQGGLPAGTLVKGSELGGGDLLNLDDLLAEDDVDTAKGGIAYDEWDYRRGGYKKEWCSLYTSDISPGREPFVELTLKRYSGAVSALRKKFELLRRERSIKRRQKDGDDVDLDAMVEAYSDIHAGVSPSDNVFSRIERQERSIAVLFLIDMSGSTRGWVNQAEKEALVLMSEALESLGDRYAVYGFSSMTRNRCELYRIKGFDEAYAAKVKRRIAGIEPKDFTRMGPFIRHTAGLLAGEDASTKLLITLSDSKPEDWDGYKGEYAVEDTRKALIEAAGLGVHPFCITIDREAQSYLPHLFGEVDYIIIDDVRKLPGRITEIYCRLTT